MYVRIRVCVFAKKNSGNVYNIMLTITSEVFKLSMCWEMYIVYSFLCGSAGKESTCNAGDLGLIPGLRRSTGKGKGYPLHYSGLKNSMDYIIHAVTKSWTRWSDFHFQFTFKNILILCIYIISSIKYVLFKGWK